MQALQAMEREHGSSVLSAAALLLPAWREALHAPARRKAAEGE
jgi:hypothetical protein